MDIKKLRDTYNRIANAYVANYRNDDWDDDFIAMFIGALPSQAKVLDLGCGPGVESAKFAAQGFDVYGLDLSDSFIALAKKQTPQGHFLQGDMRKLPYENEFFDGIFAKASLLHIPKNEIGLVIAEARRVLKPGGVFHVGIKKGKGQREVEVKFAGAEYRCEFIFWESGPFKKLMKEHGFELRKESVWDFPGRKTTWLKFLFSKNGRQLAT